MARGKGKGKSRAQRLTRAMLSNQEPDFSKAQPSDADRKMALINASNWYSKAYGAAEAKEFFIEYLEANKSDKLEAVRKLHKKHVNTTAAWIARLQSRGLILDQQQLDFINGALEKMVASGTSDAEEEAEGETTSHKVNIQTIMREKAGDASGEIDALFDKFFAVDGCPKTFLENNEVLEVLKTFKILPQHVSLISKQWEGLRAEFEEVIEGKDEQLNEAYASYTKKQMKNKLAFAEAVLAQINNYVSLKAATKKVRTRKPVPVEKLVKRLRHCKEFKDASLNLDLVGLPAAKLHGAAEAWVYDTKRRKMHHYVADDYSKSLSVKGNKVIGFDKNQSKVKTLRKPAEQIKNLTGSKPAARKYFDAIKAVSVTPKGSFKTDYIILKAF